jgi:transient receptor potential cation channel subfamily V protein 5
MFFHILNIEREIYWQIGSVTCAAYPLAQMDTIESETGGIQKESALNLIVFGEKVEHLDLMEGPVIDLLQAKWHTFVKFRFYKQFIMFFIYFLVTGAAFIYRPSHSHGQTKPTNSSGLNSSFLFTNQTLFAEASTMNLNMTALLTYPGNFSEGGGGLSSLGLIENDTFIPGLPVDMISSPAKEAGAPSGAFGFIFGWSECMQEPQSNADWFRLVCEVLMILGSVSYILGAWREWQFLGASMFFENLVINSS